MTATLVKQIEFERSFRQADFDAFAQLSGDDNPIHVDPGFAAETQFGRTIAHGVLVMTVLRGLAEKLLPGWQLSSHQTVFQAPTFADDPMRFAAAVLNDAGDQVTLSLSAVRVADDTVTCVAESVFNRC